MTRREPALILGAALLLALGGCAGLSRVGAAIDDAAREPQTWAPLAGAAVLVAGDLDQPLSDWARQETPLFGSSAAAERASDDLVALTQAGWLVAAVAASRTSDAPLEDGLRTVGIGALAIGTTGLVTAGLKDAVGRLRPDGSDDRSFPSGHTSSAAVAATLGSTQAARRLGPGAARDAVDAAFLAATIGTGWARVEAGKHYASDVLVGYSLGRFIGRVTDLAFFDPAEPVALIVTPEGLWFAVSF